ncbi:hypothetical protein E1288_35550 [Saccharopolyspora elongata]|uniref:Transposase IS701-like DDE domain-containing protein n=1 Tax=Saccharopolyspora elongata TaxID=2530387 RepID=A0A4R4Y7G0_9PSEU|nr:hypothetical protein E1288_35550 [Saccharopolyspora elongata]
MASLDAVVELIFSRFARSEPRQRVGTYLQRLLAGRERKNGWTLAKNAGAVSPDRMQRLLRTTDWDVDGARDDLRGDVLDQLGDDATGVFILDETRFIKKGLRSAWVQRQYTGTRVAGGAVGDRGVLPEREERGRARPVSGPVVAGLALPHHSGHARRRLPRCHPRPGGRKGHLGPASTG